MFIKICGKPEGVKKLDMSCMYTHTNIHASVHTYIYIDAWCVLISLLMAQKYLLLQSIWGEKELGYWGKMSLVKCMSDQPQETAYFRKLSKKLSLQGWAKVG